MPRMPSNLEIERAPFLGLGNFIRNLGLQKGEKGPLGGLDAKLYAKPEQIEAPSSRISTNQPGWAPKSSNVGTIMRTLEFGYYSTPKSLYSCL